MGSPVKLVCFDWGGVILRHCRSWPEGCAAANLTVRAGVDAPDYVLRRRALTQRFQRGDISPEAFFPALAAANDYLYSTEELVRIHDAWLLTEYEGIHDLLSALTQNPQVETALLSNTNHAHWVRHLPEDNGRQPDFPAAAILKHRHASHLMGLAKPDEAIYRAFEREVGHRGNQILFFDDLADNIAAAQRIGWRAVLIDHTGDTAAQVNLALRANNIAV